MKHTQNESSFTNAENGTNSNSTSKELVEKIPVPDSPFTIVRWDEKYYLTMGRYRLTEGLDDKDQAIQEAYDTSWNRIMQIIQIMIDENDLKKAAPLADKHLKSLTR